MGCSAASALREGAEERLVALGAEEMVATPPLIASTHTVDTRIARAMAGTERRRVTHRAVGGEVPPDVTATVAVGKVAYAMSRTKVGRVAQVAQTTTRRPPHGSGTVAREGAQAVDADTAMTRGVDTLVDVGAVDAVPHEPDMARARVRPVRVGASRRVGAVVRVVVALVDINTAHTVTRVPGVAGALVATGCVAASGRQGAMVCTEIALVDVRTRLTCADVPVVAVACVAPPAVDARGIGVAVVRRRVALVDVHARSPVPSATHPDCATEHPPS
mmetsp:Transcript_56304/g.122371  ORF Transcript_56304/g.122371 Transcript_56304/m.122371 type:complete len:275 (-) Transcript_56304:163-987(-)